MTRRLVLVIAVTATFALGCGSSSGPPTTGGPPPSSPSGAAAPPATTLPSPAVAPRSTPPRTPSAPRSAVTSDAATRTDALAKLTPRLAALAEGRAPGGAADNTPGGLVRDGSGAVVVEVRTYDETASTQDALAQAGAHITAVGPPSMALHDPADPSKRLYTISASIDARDLLQVAALPVVHDVQEVVGSGQSGG
jgi:hypothetical protein